MSTIEPATRPATDHQDGRGASDDEEADFTIDVHGKSGENEKSDSDSDSDGLPPLDAYWASKLNVSRTSQPLPAPQMLSQAELDRKAAKKQQGSWFRQGGFQKGAKGFGKFGALAPDFKGGKGLSQPRVNDIGDFVAWAQNPEADDGARPSRSRSPRRENQLQGLQSFMAWAQDSDVAKEEAEEVAAGPSNPDLGAFLSWASRPELKDQDNAPEQSRCETRRNRQGTEVAQPVESSRDDPEAGRGELPVAACELIVPAELQDELHNMDAQGEPPARYRSRREYDEDSEGG